MKNKQISKMTVAPFQLGPGVFALSGPFSIESRKILPVNLTVLFWKVDEHRKY